MGARVVRSSIVIVSLLLSTVFAGACGGGRGTAIQSPFVVNAGQTFEQTQAAVRDVLARRHWVVEVEEPGRVVAHLVVRTHRLRVDIRYDPQHVSVYYVDSDNLKAHPEPDGLYAHPKVNVWLQNLAADIAASIATVGQPGTSGGSAPASYPPGSYPPAGEPAPVPGQPQPVTPAAQAPAPISSAR